MLFTAHILGNIIAIVFVTVITLSLILMSSLSRNSSSKTKDNAEFNNQEEKPKKSVKIIGMQLERVFLYSVYGIIIGLLIIFLMLSFFETDEGLTFGDSWPFIFIVVILLFSTIVLIDRAKVQSKRTIQRDMRKQ